LTGDFDLRQRLAVFLASGAIIGGIIIVLWVRWALKIVLRLRIAAQELRTVLIKEEVQYPYIFLRLGCLSMKTKLLKNKLAMFVVIFLVFIAAMTTYSMISKHESSSERVLLVTSMGNITIELYNDMPITTGNFKNLVQRGVYDSTIFHRVIDSFMIQGGDPTGTGLGDPSIPAIQDEFTDHNSNDRGTVAMANTGLPNTGSSQFFISLVNNNYLDSQHPVFGRVIEGMDVVDSIGKVPTGSNDRPLQDVKIIQALLQK